MSRSVHFSSDSTHWATPQAVYDALDAEFHFDYDPCPLGVDGELAVDGLTSDWGDSTFCNPPLWPRHRTVDTQGSRGGVEG